MSIDATMWAWRQQQLSPTQKLILLSMADRAGEDFTCWPSNVRLCADTGLNRKTVYASIAQLIALGLLARTKMDGATNVYKLLGVSGREGTRPPVSATKHTGPKTGTSPESGTSPEIGTSPKSGLQPVPKTDFDQSQKRDTESIRESLRESPKEEGACTRSTPALSVASSATGTKQVLHSSKGSAAPSAGPKKQKEPKAQYGEFGNVLLTMQEYKNLEADYGQVTTRAAIDFLDLHLGARKGADPYKSHYLAMRKWVFDAVEEKRGKQARQQSAPAWSGKSFDELCAEADATSIGQSSASQHSTSQYGGSHETPTI